MDGQVSWTENITFPDPSYPSIKLLAYSKKRLVKFEMSMLRVQDLRNLAGQWTENIYGNFVTTFTSSKLGQLVRLRQGVGCIFSSNSGLETNFKLFFLYNLCGLDILILSYYKALKMHNNEMPEKVNMLIKTSLYATVFSLTLGLILGLRLQD